jgi:choline-sulfatase
MPSLERPNILWILTDEQRRDSVAAYGAPWAVSPILDRMAAGGTRFAAAYTPSPVCVSARVAMLTGLACSRTGVLNNHHPLPPARARFLTHAFAAAGYDTASFGKQHYNCRAVRAFDTETQIVLDERVGYANYGVPEPAGAGTVRYPGETRNWLLAGRYPGAFDETPEMRAVAAALAWLDGRDRARPFLLRVSLNAPHTPVVAPAPYDTAIDPGAIDLPIDDATMPGLPAPVRDNLCAVAGAHRLSLDQVARSRQAYYGRCAFVDAVVGRLLGALAERRVLDGTLVAFVADHGCHLADHGFYQKQSFFDASAAVPFLLAGPGLPAGRVVEAPVNVASLLPTLAALAGVELPAPLDFPSLAPALRGRAPKRDLGPVFGEIDFGIWDYRPGDRYVMVRQGDWKLSVFRDPANPARFAGDDGLALYNLRDDPGERRNRAADAGCDAVRRRLSDAVDAWDRARGAPLP